MNMVTGPNASGKTTIFLKAVCLALGGEYDGSLIRNGAQDGAHVEVTLVGEQETSPDLPLPLMTIRWEHNPLSGASPTFYVNSCQISKKNLKEMLRKLSIDVASPFAMLTQTGRDSVGQADNHERLCLLEEVLLPRNERKLKELIERENALKGKKQEKMAMEERINTLKSESQKLANQIREMENNQKKHNAIQLALQYGKKQWWIERMLKGYDEIDCLSKEIECLSDVQDAVAELQLECQKSQENDRKSHNEAKLLQEWGDAREKVRISSEAGESNNQLADMLGLEGVKNIKEKLSLDYSNWSTTFKKTLSSIVTTDVSEILLDGSGDWFSFYKGHDALAVSRIIEGAMDKEIVSHRAKGRADSRRDLLCSDPSGYLA
jgi:hypothetical protein